MTELELVQSAQIPMPKTAEDHQRELATLEIELRHITALKDSIEELGRDWQRKLTLNLSGRATVAEVEAAQRRFDEASAALARIPALTRAVANARTAAEWAAGDERKAFFDSVADRAAARKVRCKELAEQLLAEFRELEKDDQQYLALTGRSVMDAFWRECNLPMLTGPLAGRSGFTTCAYVGR